jgi:hypothetical protein
LAAPGEAEAGAALAADLLAAAWAAQAAMQVKKARVDARSEAGVIGRQWSGQRGSPGEREAAGESEGGGILTTSR